MSFLRSATLHDGDAVRVADVACCAPRSGCGAEEQSAQAELIVVRRGVFALHRGRRSVVADPTTAVLVGAGAEHRVSHPADGGDRCTAIALGPDAAQRWGQSPALRAVPLDAAAQLRLATLAGALGRGPADPLAAEEATLLAVGDALAGASGAASRPAGTAASTAARRRAADVRALLAADPARRWRLADVGRAVHTSPYHLARSFRTATGTTIGAHLARLRLAVALDRMADGETDLARVALDAGFAHHSHFTARFRATFGTTPSAARHAGSTVGASRSAIDPARS